MNISKLRVGQIWVENDKRFTRYVRILKVQDGRVTTMTCDEEGKAIPRTLKHTTNRATRFNFKSGGFSLFKEVVK